MEQPQLITHLTGEINYTWLHFEDGKKQLCARTLKLYEAAQPDFIRIHKQTLVNPKYVQALIPLTRATKTGFLVLRNGIKLSVSRRRWAAVAALFLSTVDISRLSHAKTFSRISVQLAV